MFEEINDFKEDIRRIEAYLFASDRLVTREMLQSIMIKPENIDNCMSELRDFYKFSYIDVVDDGGYKFTVDMAALRNDADIETKVVKIDGTALIVLSIVALHQPVTYPEIVDLVGEPVSRKVLDRLVSIEMIRALARKSGTGRAIAYVTTEEFLDAFKLEDIDELPSIEEVLSDYRPPRLVDANLNMSD